MLYNNVCHLSPDRYSPLAEQFAQQFPGHDLPSMLAKFSLPVSLAEFRNPLEAPAQEVRLLYKCTNNLTPPHWTTTCTLSELLISWPNYYFFPMLLK